MDLFIDPEFGKPDDTPAPLAVSAPMVLDPGDQDHQTPAVLPELPPRLDQTPPSRFQPAPSLPLIATLPIAGIIADSGQIVFDGVDPNGKRAAVGSTSANSRPGVLGLALRVSAGAGTVYLLPDGQPDSQRNGYSLVAAAGWELLPLKRCNLWLTGGAVTVDYALVLADVPLDL